MSARTDEFAAGTTWRPDQGEHPRTITGTLLDVRTVSGNYGKYPLLSLEQDDGTTWDVHAFRDVLKNELAALAPQLGESISISYGGKSEKGYYRYRVYRADGSHGRVQWGQFSDDTPALDSDTPADMPLPKEPSRSEQMQEQAEAAYGDDIPFLREADKFEFDLFHAHANR